MAAAEVRKETRSKQYRKRRTHDLPQLKIGDTVFVQDNDGRKHWIKEGVITGLNGPRGYNVKIGDSAETTRDRKHLRPAHPDKHYVIPDDWLRSELDTLVPYESATETSQDEWPDSDEDTDEVAVEPHPEQPLEPAVRRSTRIANGKTSCQSCVGCKLIHNYLNVIDNFKVSVKKLPQILRWAIPL